MLTTIYQSAKARLAAQVTILQDIQWYNRQYESIMVADPAAYIEFPEQIEIDNISKTTTRADVTLRIHVVSKVITDADYTIPDDQLVAHESTAALVLAALRNHTLATATGVAVCASLQYNAYSVKQDVPGLIITILTLTTRLTV